MHGGKRESLLGQLLQITVTRHLEVSNDLFGHTKCVCIFLCNSNLTLSPTFPLQFQLNIWPLLHIHLTVHVDRKEGFAFARASFLF